MVDITYRGKVPAEYLKDFPNVLEWYNACSEHKGIKENHDNELFKGMQAMAAGLYTTPVEKKE